jgi:hypothetical protein
MIIVGAEGVSASHKRLARANDGKLCGEPRRCSAFALEQDCAALSIWSIGLTDYRVDAVIGAAA